MKTPYLEDAEVEFLAMVIFGRDYEKIGEISGLVRPNQLHLDRHRRAYAAAIGLHKNSVPFTIDGLHRQMVQLTDPENRSPYSEQEDQEWLAELSGAVVGVRAENYIPLLLRDDARRRTIAGAHKIIAEMMVDDPSRSAASYVGAAEKVIQDIGNYVDASEFIGMKGVMDEAMAAIDKAFKGQGISGVPTGLKAFDDRHGGLQPGNLLILAGRPSMGKTAVSTNWSVSAAKAGTAVAYFSFEMALRQIGQRILSQETEINSQAMRSGVKLSDFPTLEQGRKRLDKLPLFFEKRSVLNANEIRSTLRRAKRRHNIGMAVIDYLELIDPMDANALTHEHLGKTTQTLKAAATELDIPVVLLCQLSRAVEQRDDKRPVMSDLRGSGKIEQDADVIVFVFREEYYLENQAPPKEAKAEIEFHQRKAAARGKLDLITAKFRDGKIGTDTFVWEPEKQLVRDADQWGR